MIVMHVAADYYIKRYMAVITNAWEGRGLQEKQKSNL